MEQAWPSISFHVPFRLHQYESTAVALTVYSGLVFLTPAKPAWDAELDGVRLQSDMADSAPAGPGFLMLIPGRVSGTSSSSSSSLEDSDSEPESSDAESLEETSEGWYSCFNGDDIRRFAREPADGSTGGMTGDVFLGLSVRWIGGGGAPSSRKGAELGDVFVSSAGSGRISSRRGRLDVSVGTCGSGCDCGDLSCVEAWLREGARAAAVGDEFA